MTNENQAPTPPYFSDKRIDYLHMDLAFLSFAVECQASADEITSGMETAIRTRHHEARAVHDCSHVTKLWYLETDIVKFYYQVTSDVVVIGSICCRATGSIYEPGQDLLAEYES